MQFGLHQVANLGNLVLDLAEVHSFYHDDTVLGVPQVEEELLLLLEVEEREGDWRLLYEEAAVDEQKLIFLAGLGRMGLHFVAGRCSSRCGCWS